MFPHLFSAINATNKTSTGFFAKVERKQKLVNMSLPSCLMMSLGHVCIDFQLEGVIECCDENDIVILHNRDLAEGIKASTAALKSQRFDLLSIPSELAISDDDTYIKVRIYIYIYIIYAMIKTGTP